MNCPQCAAPTQPGQKFCARCGSPLSISPTSPVSPPPPHNALETHTASQPTPYPYPYPPTTNPTQRSRSRAPLITTLVAALALLAIPAVALTLLLTSRTEAIEPVDPEATLKLASTALSDVKTLRYSSEVGFFGVNSGNPGITDTQTLTLTVKGDVALPNNFTLSSNIPQLGQYVTIGDDTWKRDTEGDPWTQQSTADSSLGLVNPILFTSYLRYYEPGTAQLVSSSKQGDDTLHRIRFKVDATRMAAGTTDRSTRQTLQSSRISADAWVDDKTHLIDRMTLSVEMENGAGVILRTAFSDYNTPMDIEPPR